VRIEGRIEGNYYVIAHAGTLKRIPLDQARTDSKLLKAIERNGWEKLNG
jgi:hypothetical protein